MFYNLPNETKLDILKCLNFDHLFIAKQINCYFNNFIDIYKEELARKEFGYIEITEFTSYHLKVCKVILPEYGLIKFELNDELRKKWQSVLDKKIPIYMGMREYYPKINHLSTILGFTRVALRLTVYPKNFEDLKIIRCWFEQIFQCAFRNVHFDNFVFNPEMIELIFEEKENISLKLFSSKACLFNNINPRFDNKWKFIFEHLNIGEDIQIKFSRNDNNTEIYNNILLELLLNKGYKFPLICIKQPPTPTIINLIIIYIEMSTDCTNMTNNIIFTGVELQNFKLSEGAKNIKKIIGTNSNILKYQLVNIYNPMITFSIKNKENNEGTVYEIEIKRI